MEDTTMVLLLLGALVLGYYAKDLIGPVCGIADTVVDELEDDELALERSLKKQQTQQMLLLGGIVLLGVCFMMTQTGQKGGNGGEGSGEGEGEGDGEGRSTAKRVKSRLHFVFAALVLAFASLGFFWGLKVGILPLV